MSWAGRAAKGLGIALLFIVVALVWAVLLVPPLLDRIYYDGPVTDHYDGERFFNPDGEDTSRPPGGGGRGSFIWRQITGNDARPPWPTQVAVTPARPPARVTGDRMLATWVGHATVLVQAGGVNILTDPIWSERAGPFGFGPRRVARPGVRLEDLPNIDLVVVSHNHYDHMDLATLKRLWARDKPLIVTSLGNDTVIAQAGVPATALDWGESVRENQQPNQQVQCLTPDPSCTPRYSVRIERNHHWGSRWFTDRNRALWSAFSISTPAGNIFFAGDTGLGDGRWPAEAAARSGPFRLAIIPIGAFRFEPGKLTGTASHVGPIEAARVFDDLGASWGLPVHWGTFRLSYEGRDTPPRMLAGVMACHGYPAPAPFVARGIGQAWEVPPARPRMPRPDVADFKACLTRPEIAGLP